MVDQTNGFNSPSGIGGPGGLAWGMFAATGGIGYYMLYKDLEGGSAGPDKEDPRFR